MNKKLEDALDKVEMTYKELVEIANDMTKSILEPINISVDCLNKDIQNLSIEQIRNYILELQLKAFEISEIKEKSLLKAELADAIQKEAFAISFNSLAGSAAAKEKLALVDVSEETLVEALYSLIAGLLKAKIDQLHRLVDCLKSILMSRMQEIKAMNVGVDNEIPQTVNSKVLLKG